jgi:hypothetical protein
MSLCSFLSDSLFVFAFFIGFSCSFLAFISAFAAIFITLKEVISLASWSDIARPFCVLEKLNSPRSEGRFTPDLRFLS